ncbi:ATPase [Nonlabens sp. SY33080]|uniref:ATPase n=1 Tax=Nonlabens sp. SY33080 TaxID=2719911 RepID=UPI001428B087|nr:ATPase [Nonlabens sp. SY33080]
MKHPETSFDLKNPGILILGSSQFQVAELKDKLLQYDFKSALRFLDAKGKLLFGKQFKIYEEDKALLYRLVTYFIGDQSECNKFQIDLNKGLLLSGPVGCGKTTLMRLLPHLVPHKRYHQFNLIPCRNIVFGFNNLGYKTIEAYSDRKSYCFDDLGVEAIGRHYGKDCNVMGEILISRYEVFRQKQVKTHITSNLNAEELESKYGERVRSRMREMFNLISFNNQAKDKRG